MPIPGYYSSQPAAILQNLASKPGVVGQIFTVPAQKMAAVQAAPQGQKLLTLASTAGTRFWTQLAKGATATDPGPLAHVRARMAAMRAGRAAPSAPATDATVMNQFGSQVALDSSTIVTPGVAASNPQRKLLAAFST